MLKIEETDFHPLESFSLKWRWTDSRWNKLPDEVLNEIQPLTEVKAQEFYQYSLQFENQLGPIKSLFEHLEQINANDETLVIERWLIACSSDLNQKVIISWDKNHTALVKWKVFCTYWDDFCYPASDDVVIFPLSEEWMLFYSHNEYFDFGKRKQPNLNMTKIIIK